MESRSVLAKYILLLLVFMPYMSRTENYFSDINDVIVEHLRLPKTVKNVTKIITDSPLKPTPVQSTVSSWKNNQKITALAVFVGTVVATAAYTLCKKITIEPLYAALATGDNDTPYVYTGNVGKSEKEIKEAYYSHKISITA